MYKHTQLADRRKEHDSLVTELKQSNISMLQKYRSKAVKSGLTNVDILEAPADDVAKEILRMADKENIDTIIVGSRGLEAPKDLLLGSVSYKIGHYSRCPGKQKRYCISDNKSDFIHRKIWIIKNS